jgi:hypothetical protein
LGEELDLLLHPVLKNLEVLAGKTVHQATLRIVDRNRETDGIDADAILRPLLPRIAFLGSRSSNEESSGSEPG